jgi:hypothetical protein
MLCVVIGLPDELGDAVDLQAVGGQTVCLQLTEDGWSDCLSCSVELVDLVWDLGGNRDFIAVADVRDGNSELVNAVTTSLSGVLVANSESHVLSRIRPCGKVDRLDIEGVSRCVIECGNLNDERVLASCICLCDLDP